MQGRALALKTDRQFGALTGHNVIVLASCNKTLLLRMEGEYEGVRPTAKL